MRTKEEYADAIGMIAIALFLVSLAFCVVWILGKEYRDFQTRHERQDQHPSFRD